MQRRSEHEMSIRRFTFQHWATDAPIQASFSGKASCPSGHFTSGKHSTHDKAKIQQRRPRTVDQLENGTATGLHPQFPEISVLLLKEE